MGATALAAGREEAVWMRQRADFRRLVARLRDECARQGFEPSAGLLEDLIDRQVQAMADLLGVQVATVLRSHTGRINIPGLAAEIVAADRLRRREVADTPHVILDLAGVGRLVSSLGQAVRCVSLNHDTIGQSEAARWAAVGVLDDTGNALTLLGSALEDSHRSGSLSVVLSDETVVYARRGLAETVKNLRSRRWSFGQALPDIDAIDAKVADRMDSDLALLPPG
jgi:hypothetical protein